MSYGSVGGIGSVGPPGRRRIPEALRTGNFDATCSLPTAAASRHHRQLIQARSRWLVPPGLALQQVKAGKLKEPSGADGRKPATHGSTRSYHAKSRRPTTSAGGVDGLVGPGQPVARHHRTNWRAVPHWCRDGGAPRQAFTAGWQAQAAAPQKEAKMRVKTRERPFSAAYRDAGVKEPVSVSPTASRPGAAEPDRETRIRFRGADTTPAPWPLRRSPQGKSVAWAGRWIRRRAVAGAAGPPRRHRAAMRGFYAQPRAGHGRRAVAGRDPDTGLAGRAEHVLGGRHPHRADTWRRGV